MGLWLCTRTRCSRARQWHSRTRTSLESRSFSADRAPGPTSTLILLARCLCGETRHSLRDISRSRPREFTGGHSSARQLFSRLEDWLLSLFLLLQWAALLLFFFFFVSINQLFPRATVNGRLRRLVVEQSALYLDRFPIELWKRIMRYCILQVPCKNQSQIFRQGIGISSI